MYMVQMYERIRRLVLIEGLSKRKAAKLYGVNRRTVDKMCQYSAPPGYRRKQEKKHPKLGDYISNIEEILSSDLLLPKKQRHTAKRIYDRLREEYGYCGGYDSVRRYVVEHKQSKKEVYIPLNHEFGTAQVDFGECIGIIGGIETKLHYFVMSLCKSSDIFVKAYYAEDQVSWFDGHVTAFEHFGGVPSKIVYDNASALIKKIGKYGLREVTKRFDELKSHYLFEALFANPAKGNEKGIVENRIGYVRRNFFVPYPKYQDIEKLNKYLKMKCLSRRNQKHFSNNKLITELFVKEQEALLSLPHYPYESCDINILKINSCSLVRYKTNDYSVPTDYAYKDVTLKAYHDIVIIFYKNKEIASHRRMYGKYEQSYNYLHYLPILIRKSRAFDQAKPLKDLILPQEFNRLRHTLEQKYEGTKGKREYIEILQLLAHHNQCELTRAIKEAFRIGVVNIESIKQILHRSKDIEIGSIDKNLLIGIPDIYVQAPCLDQYNALLSTNVRSE